VSISDSAQRPSASQGSTDLEALLDDIREDVDKAGDISLEGILDAVGTRAYGPLLLIPGLLALAPTGAIPGMSVVTGTLILLIAAQLLIGRNSPWLPRRALEFSFSKDRLINAIELGKPYARRIDSVLKPSLSTLTKFPATRIVALVAMALAITMYPLALVPFAVAIPSAAIVLFALGLTARDGRLIIAALISAGLALLALYHFFA
jgi:hypothetical protein